MSSPRYRRLLAIGALDAGLVAGLYALEPALVTDTVRSPRALGLVALTTVAAMVLGRIGKRAGGPILGAAAAVVPLALVGWVVVRPAVRDVRLDEPRIVAESSSDLPGPAPAATAAPQTTGAQLPAATGAAAGPTKVLSGPLSGIGHDASGTVAVYRMADGSHVVQFEDVAIEGSPDPVLYLVPGRDQRSRDGGTKVSDLKGTHGTFHHTVPASFDLTSDFTVFIWCDRFATAIAHATPSRA